MCVGGGEIECVISGFRGLLIHIIPFLLLRSQHLINKPDYTLETLNKILMVVNSGLNNSTND